MSGDCRAASDQERMREDWNRRAREDAHYYVAFGRREQEEAEFLATGGRLVQGLEEELKRLPPTDNRRCWRALEIGCGPGRLMKPLSAHFGEIHGVDVSDEMVALARERLHGIAHAHVHVTDGATLAAFADESFNFVYSYAVFQHVPSRDVVWQYLEETRRVLKPGGIFRGQLNGLPPLVGGEYDTWAGCRFSADEIRTFARDRDFDLLELSGVNTQYMWTTWRRRGGPADAAPAPSGASTRVRRVTNAFSTEPLAPASGRYAAISLWIEDLPRGCELNGLDATIAGIPAVLFYLGPPAYDGLRQLSMTVPPGVRTGLQPVEVVWRGQSICGAILRVVPPGPCVPRIVAVNDAVNLLSSTRISSGLVKIVTEELADPALFAAAVDGVSVGEVHWFCTDPQPPRFEFNLTLPEHLSPGRHTLSISYGNRRFAPVELETEAVVRGPGA